MIAALHTEAVRPTKASDMIRRPLLVAALAGLAAAVAAGAASAQAVPTAQGRGDELTTAQQIEAWTRDAPPASTAPPTLAASRGALGADSPWAEGGGPVPFIPYDAPPIARTMTDGRIHGEVGAEVGNRGYGGYAVASGPLGDHGAVQVGVSDFQGTGGRRGGYWNGDHKSLNVGVALDFSRDRKPPADAPSPSY